MIGPGRPTAAASSRDDWDRARLYGRTALGLLRYHYWMAATSPARMTRLVGVRDQMMAHNLLAVAARGPALIHAHNSHLQREKSTMRMGGMPLEWWSAGALVSTQLGEGYAFVATALGTIRHQGVDTPPPDTVEGLLYALPRRPPPAHRIEGAVTPGCCRGLADRRECSVSPQRQRRGGEAAGCGPAPVPVSES